ncbi:MAG: hypothetical protein K0Q68_3082 [Moraxellaceae bacterium]|jgi:uncharacterized membrane protein YGL010W|nr:hypothetical protein [Moraxellaceae bacterium]
MKTLNEWLDEYGESHQNKVNKAIHWICVPVIYFCVFALLHSLHPWAAWGGLAVALAFYIPVSLPLALGMLVLTVAMLALIPLIPQVLWVAVGLFVVTWIFQFIGHRIEGKKPSFFKDLQFLLVGPIWLLNFVYKRLGLPT